MWSENQRNAIQTGVIAVCLLPLFIGFCMALSGCQPSKPEPAKTITIPDGEIDPEVWGKAYPDEYNLWKKTEEPEPAGKSKYKRGFDADRPTYDRLSEYPYMALLFDGWGFGVEYNEPRGHANMIRDQLEVDAARLKSGGVCLSCKTPYAPKLQKEMGADYYKLPYKEVLLKIPEKNRALGVACIDCHNNQDMSLRLSRGFTLIEAFKAMGVDPDKLSRQEMRTARLRPMPRYLQYSQRQGHELRRPFFPLAKQQVWQYHHRRHY